MGKRGPKRKLQPDLPKIGDNGGMISDENKKKLQGYVSEVERIATMIAEMQADMKLIYQSADESNFSTKAIRALVKERKQDRTKREAFATLCDAYRHALGMLDGTPLGQAAMAREGLQQAAE